MKRVLAAVMVVLPLAGSATPAMGAPVALGRIWMTRFNAQGNRDDSATDVAVSPDGTTVYVTGVSDEFGMPERYVTLAYDAGTGDVRWIARHGGSDDGSYNPPVLALSSDGATLAIGGFAGSEGVVVAYEASTGIQRWDARFQGDPVAGIGVTPDGSRVLATGTIPGTGEGFGDYGTVAYDGNTGGHLWTARYADRDGLVDDPHALGVSPDGGSVFVTGYSQSADFFSDYATVAYDAATGAEQWVARYNGPGSGYDNGADLAVSHDGSTVVVTGNSDSGGPGSSDDYATVAYDAATGAKLWASRYDGVLHSEDDARIVRVSSDNSLVVVTGDTSATVSVDYGTVAYDMATGTQRWVATYHGPGNLVDIPGDLVVSPVGDVVIVTGQSDGSGTQGDFATIAYDAVAGTQVAISRIGTGGNDAATAMGMSAAGSRLFVTGQVEPSSQDYGTVAYGWVP